MQILLTVLAILIAAGSLIFSGLQTRIIAKQTAVLTVTSKLSYNFQIINRLEQILLRSPMTLIRMRMRGVRVAPLIGDQKLLLRPC